MTEEEKEFRKQTDQLDLKKNDGALRAKKIVLSKQIEMVQANRGVPEQIIAKNRANLGKIVTNTNDLIVRQRQFRQTSS